MKLSGKNLSFQELNEAVRDTTDEHIELCDILGHRYIGAGSSGRDIVIEGVPGNALGAYLSGSSLTVKGNAQDAVGDTMNDGRIIISGSCGDTAGYAMRGGKIYIGGNAGYRVGIHMKEYGAHSPIIVIGGRAGAFLGEYQAGGTIVVLGLGGSGCPIGGYCGTGMHGGRMFIRGTVLPGTLSDQVLVEEPDRHSRLLLKEILSDYCRYFPEVSANSLLKDHFFLLTPNTKNPFKQLYTAC